VQHRAPPLLSLQSRSEFYFFSFFISTGYGAKIGVSDTLSCPPGGLVRANELLTTPTQKRYFTVKQ